MSIIATVYLKEGIIMAADSRITGTATHPEGTIDRLTLSDNGQKIFLIKDETIGISECGDQVIDGKTISDYIRVFELEKVKEQDTVSVVAEKLRQFTVGKHKGSVIFHVCGYCKGLKYVYCIENDKLSVIIGDANHDVCNVAWSGETKVVSNLLTGENAIPIEWDFMQLKDGIDFAEFLADITCKVHRFQKGLGTCGGPIDILLLTKDYSKWIRHKIFNP